jgi:hypothetical protein
MSDDAADAVPAALRQSAVGRPRRAAWSPSFRTLKWLSFAHSTAYLVLLTCWLADWEGQVKHLAGWGHGVGWIVMCVLSLLAVRARVIPLALAVCVTVIGAVGPFVGSAGFVWEDRRRRS